MFRILTGITLAAQCMGTQDIKSASNLLAESYQDLKISIDKYNEFYSKYDVLALIENNFQIPSIEKEEQAFSKALSTYKLAWENNNIGSRNLYNVILCHLSKHQNIKNDGIIYNRDDVVYSRDDVLDKIRTGKVTFESISQTLQNDRGIALTATKYDGLSIQYMSDRFKNDEKIVSAALQQNGLALEFVPDKFKKDRSMVLKAVKQNGLALKYAHEKLRYSYRINYIEYYELNKIILLEAIKQNGFAIAYIIGNGPNQYLAFEAVRQNGLAIAAINPWSPGHGASWDDLVIEAIKQNKNALHFIPKHKDTGLNNALREYLIQNGDII